MVETERQMAARHVSEQLVRIERQEALIRRLQAHGLFTVQAAAILDEMRDLLSEMRAHLAAIPN